MKSEDGDYDDDDYIIYSVYGKFFLNTNCNKMSG